MLLQFPDKLDVIKSMYEVLCWLYLKVTITLMIIEDTADNLQVSCRQKGSYFLYCSFLTIQR